MSNEINTYLTFKVKEHLFGIKVTNVLEISEYVAPKSMPESEVYIAGVVEFRDQVIPLIDCGVKFNLGAIEVNALTCVVALELYNESLGKKYKAAIVVDAVSDVFEADDTSIKDLEDEYHPEYIKASYKSENGLVLILDADKVFSEKDIIAIDKVINTID